MRTFFLLSFLLASTLFASPTTLTVGASASHAVPADQVSLSLSVVTRAKEVQSAITDNDAKMNQVISSLKKLGLTSKEFRTGRFSVQPIYSKKPENAPKDWSAAIVAYEVSNRLEVSTGQLDLLGQLIETVASSGVNQIDQTTFGLQNEAAHKKEAIQAATSLAMQNAQNLAEASGVHLAKIQQITLDGAATQPVRWLYMAKGMDSFAPGEIEVNASVTIVYEIE